MVLYDFMMIAKSSVPKTQVADILRRTGLRILDAQGVITDITSFGTRTLAYEFKTPGEKHFEVRERIHPTNTRIALLTSCASIAIERARRCTAAARLAAQDPLRLFLSKHILRSSSCGLGFGFRLV
jgi:ribosomal protein S6